MNLDVYVIKNEIQLSMLKSFIEHENYCKRKIIFFISLFFLSDFVTKILIIYGDFSFNRIAGVVKLIFELIMLFYLFKKGKINLVLVLAFTLLLAFIISAVYYVINTGYQIDYKTIIKNIYYTNRYLYVFVFIAFFELYDIGFLMKDNFIKIFKTIFYINSVLIIIGLLYQIEIFRSYYATSRFGYNGIFSKHGEAVYYYMFFITILYFEYIKNKTLNNIVKIIVVSAISVLMGKKAILLFLFLLTISHIIFVLKKGKALVFVLLFFTAGLVFLRKVALTTLFTISPYWENQYQYQGFMGMLTSTRSKLLINFFNYVQLDWNILNFLFGMGAYDKYKVEFEFVDLFMFFGVTGIIVFIYLFKMFFYRKDHRLSLYLLLCVLITSFFSGALFLSVTSMMLFYIVFEWINNSDVTPI